MAAIAVVAGFLLAACAADVPDKTWTSAPISEDQAGPPAPSDEPETTETDDPQDLAEPTVPERPAVGDARGDIPAPPQSRDAVRSTAQTLLDGLLSETDAGTDAFGVLVVDEHGREIVEHAADAARIPASTLKIVTGAAALTTLGPNATFTTWAEASGPVADDGTLEGDLAVVGDGDPVLATPEYGRFVYPARPRTPLEDLADDIVDAGVRHIDGDVLAVTDRFEGPRTATGWPDRYFSSFDARYTDGLTVDAGLETIIVWPDPDDDDGPDGDGDAADDDATASDVDDLDPFDPPEDLEPTARVEHVEVPAQHLVDELVRLLDDRGVTVAGSTGLTDTRPKPVGLIAQVDSPPLSELLAFTLQRSDNHLAEGLFTAVGRQRTGVGSFSSGNRALRQSLDRWGIEHGAARFADGSGLSREDRASARLLVDVERAMYSSRHAGTWKRSMAVTGESGTLRNRLRGTIADGRFAGKTGTLRDTTGVVGTVEGTGGQRYHLAVLANDAGEGRWLARALTDELILLLTADLDGCSVSFSDGDPAELGQPPLDLAC